MLKEWIESNNIKKPIKLEITLKKVSYVGCQSRYFKVEIDGHDVTQMIANEVNLKISKASSTYGCLIIHGCGMDMGFDLQSRLYNKFRDIDDTLFDRSEYILKN